MNCDVNLENTYYHESVNFQQNYLTTKLFSSVDLKRKKNSPRLPYSCVVRGFEMERRISATSKI